MSSRDHEGNQGWNERPGRSLFGWLPRIGMNLLSFFADGGAAASGGYKADIAPPCNQPITNVKCCYLACPNTECKYPDGDKSKFTCPEGYTKTQWTCCEGSLQVACGECAGGNSCYTRPWNCSIWFYTGVPAC